MIKSETRNRLEEFNKRVEYIRTLSYFNGGKNTVGFEIKEAGKIDFYEPNDEQRDALLLNVRLFLQDKDDISIRRLTDLFDDPGISSEWKKEYELHRKELNKKLDWVAVEGLKEKLPTEIFSICSCMADLDIIIKMIGHINFTKSGSRTKTHMRLCIIPFIKS